MSFYLALGIIAALVAVVLYFATRSKSSSGGSGISVVPPNGPVQRKKQIVEAPTGPKIALFFGSQTGTAEGFAQKLADEFRARSFDSHTYDLDEFDPETFASHQNVVVVIATYGEGEPTDNARTFHKWIIDKSLEDTILSNMNFMVFSLGNRQYDHYQAMGKLVDSRLEQLGARRIFRRGEGDDDGSIEEDFASWKEEMWPAVMSFFGLSNTGVVAESTHNFKYKITWSSDHDAPSPVLSRKTSSSLDSVKHVRVILTRNDELHTAYSNRSCRHIEFDLGNNPHLSYDTGDHVAIAPHNNATQVVELASRLGVGDIDAEFALVDDEGATPFPCPCSVRTALTQYVEINSIKKSLLSTLATFAVDPNEAEKIRFLASKDGKNEFEGYSIKGMRTMLDLLNDFRSLNIPIEKFLELMPRLQPRYYSIASSSIVYPRSIHIAAAVEYVSFPDGREFHGVCTSYLSRLAPGSEVEVFVRQSNFKLPKDISTPCIMIGPGTGFAPIRGFMQELTHHARSSKTALGKNMLFFGCQNRQHDFIYEHEIMRAVSDNVFWKVNFAFSREQAHKVYVQNKVEEEKENVLQLLENGAYLHICGASRMAKDVRATLIKSACEQKSWTSQQGEEWLHQMQQQGRFLQDVWG